jgi:hypothetical protein
MPQVTLPNGQVVNIDASGNILTSSGGIFTGGGAPAPTIPLQTTAGATSTSTPYYAGLTAEQNAQQAAQQAAAQKEQQRQNYINQGRTLQQSGAGLTAMQNYLASVPAEFRFDVAQNMEISGVGTQGAVSQTGTTGTTGVLPNTSSPQYDNALTDLLNNPNLTDDQKALFKEVYNLISINDKDKADRFAAAFDAATTYSSPLFKAQVLMATTSLKEGLESITGDYNYAEQKQLSTIKSLEANLAAIQGYGSFEDTQNYKDLIASYKKDLETTQEKMVTTGFTTSSRRSKAEQLLAEQNVGLVESGRRAFSYKTGELQSRISDVRGTIAYLTDKETQDKIAKLREAEELVGTPTLSNLGYTGLLGGVGGTLPREQIASNLEFAKSFVF